MIRIIVPGPPPRKNAKSGTSIGRNAKTGRPMRLPSKRNKAWRARLYDALTEDGRRLVTIKRGTWALRIDVYDGKARHLSCGAVVGLGDHDSALEPICDALKTTYKTVHGTRVVWSHGVFDDDDRIVTSTITKHYDKANPRVEIVLTEVS